MCCCGIDIDLLLKLLGPALSIVTLFLAWKIYKNFDVKKQYLNQQLLIVNKLASDIASNEVYFTFYLRAQPPPNYSGNQDLPRSITGYRLDFFSSTMATDVEKFPKVFVQGRYITEVFPFLDYRNNPLLPSKIAKCLRELYYPLEYTLSISDDDLPDNYITLSPIERKNNDPLSSFLYPYQDSKDLKQKSENLRKEIIEWLKTYGAEDINF